MNRLGRIRKITILTESYAEIYTLILKDQPQYLCILLN